MLDTFRSGTAPAVIRRKGAEGDLPVPLEEKIEILVVLSGDPEESIRQTALATLNALDPKNLLPVVASPSASGAALEFAATHLAPERREIQEALLKNPALPEPLRELVQTLHQLPDEPAEPATAPPAVSPQSGAGEAGGEDPKRETLIQKLNRMSAAEKIKTALVGSQDERLLLIRDSNKVVTRAVLQSPKLSDREVENFSSMKNVSEEVLRLIAMNRKFIKSYQVVRQLVNNPRTPIDVGLPLINRLNERDLKGLTLNKNIADVLRSMSTKLIKQKEDASKPKVYTKKH